MRRSLAKIYSYLIIIMNMCVVYWSEIHQLKYQRGLIFNGLDQTLNGESMRFWLTFFIGFVFAHFLSIWHEDDIIQQLKAWSFRMWKNLVHTHSNSDSIARWRSITFFYTPCIVSFKIFQEISLKWKLWLWEDFADKFKPLI
jgi:hypothetical protein